MVFYTYDIVTKELKEECIIPFDSQYACGVVSRAKNMVYYSGGSRPDTLASKDLVKDEDRTLALNLKTEDDVVSATQISRNEFLVEINHMDWDTLETESKLYSLVFKNGKGTLTPADSPYPHSSDWKTADGGRTFYFMLQSAENPERGLYCYSTETRELTPVICGNPKENGHVINFSILAPGS